MEVTYKTRGIILRREPYGEDDSRVFVYTQDCGKLDLIARGTQKLSSKLASHIEPLNLGEIMVVRGKQYDYLGSAISEDVFANTKGNYDKIAIAGEILKLVNDTVKEKQAEQEIFLLLKEFLEILNTNAETQNFASLLKILSMAFILKFLSLLGYAPELYKCVACQKELALDNNKFNFSKGGVICKTCGVQDGIAISKEVIEVMRLMLTQSWRDIGELKSANEIIIEAGKFISQCEEYCLVDFLRQRR